MVRTGPSAADVDLIAAARRYGVEISPAQLERWRAAGVLPRNRRRGRGRGRGSMSRTEPGTIEAAVAIASFSRPGVSTHIAVLEWFMEASYPIGASDQIIRIPEPPFELVRSAFVWHARRTSIMALPKTSAAGGSDDDRLDGAYTTAERIVGQRQVTDPLAFQEVQEVLAERTRAGRTRIRMRAAKAALVQGLVLQTFGAEEVGTEAFVEQLSESRAPFVDFRPLKGTDAYELSVELLVARGEPDRCAAASPSDFTAARDLARLLAGFGALCRIMSWDTSRVAEIDSVAASFCSHGLGLLLAPGMTMMKALNIIPAVMMFLVPRYRAVGIHLLDDLDRMSPFSDVSTLRARLDARHMPIRT